MATPSPTDIPLPERFFAGGGTSLARIWRSTRPARAIRSPGFPIGGQALLVFNQDLRFPMHLPLIGNRLGGAVFYDAGNVFPSIRKISLRTAPPVPMIVSHREQSPTTVCLTNCTNELNYFSHTVGFEFRYGTPIGPVALDLGYQLNPARFLVQTDACMATSPCRARQRCPGCRPFNSSSTWGRRSDAARDIHFRRASGRGHCGARDRVLRPAPQAGRVVDRIVARIEDDIILQSQVRELGAFQQLIEGHAESDDQLLAELIEQWMVQTEATASHFPQPAQSEVDRELARLTAQFRKPRRPIRPSSTRLGLSADAGAAVARAPDLCRTLSRL